MDEYNGSRLESELQSLADDVNVTKLHVEAIDATTRALAASQRDLFCRVQIAEKNCSACRSTNDKLSELCAKHTRALEYLQFKQRTKNLIVHNVKETYLKNYNNIADGILHLFNSHGIHVNEETVESASRIGNGTLPNQPVRVTFVSSKHKRVVFRGVKNLRGLGVSVANDLSKEQREQRKILNLYRKRLNEMGKRTYLRDTKLIHENVAYNVHTLPQLLEDINVDPDNFSHLQVATKVNGAVIYITLDEALRQPMYLADCEIVRPSELMRGDRVERKPLRVVDPAEVEQQQAEQEQQQQQKEGEVVEAAKTEEAAAVVDDGEPVAGPSAESQERLKQRQQQEAEAADDDDDDDDNDSVKSCNVIYDASLVVHRRASDDAGNDDEESKGAVVAVAEEAEESKSVAEVVDGIEGDGGGSSSSSTCADR